ncbi:MAG: hypothetical protein M3Z25_23235 [Actinomycetota bacterium]|nr:hypothetical protein [Actinomycetota bacterium]
MDDLPDDLREMLRVAQQLRAEVDQARAGTPPAAVLAELRSTSDVARDAAAAVGVLRQAVTLSAESTLTVGGGYAQGAVNLAGTSHLALAAKAADAAESALTQATDTSALIYAIDAIQTVSPDFDLLPDHPDLAEVMQVVREAEAVLRELGIDLRSSNAPSAKAEEELIRLGEGLTPTKRRLIVAVVWLSTYVKAMTIVSANYELAEQVSTHTGISPLSVASLAALVARTILKRFSES